jgi:hypothetical protein
MQLAWLTADLTAASLNRKAVPWIMVMSHFPLFHTQTHANENMSASHYTGEFTVVILTINFVDFTIIIPTLVILNDVSIRFYDSIS